MYDCAEVWRGKTKQIERKYVNTVSTGLYQQMIQILCIYAHIESSKEYTARILQLQLIFYSLMLI